MSRPDRRRTALATGAVLFAGTWLATVPNGTTYAAWSDFAVIADNHVGAGIWAPDPPAACGDPAGYKGGVVYGTPGNDVLVGGNKSQIILGLGGDDVIRGGNSGDCLVGGPGNDRLYGGTAKDILIGGDNDDLLEGNNGKDLLDGGPGVDTCVGGNGMDTLQDCEAGDVGPPAPLRLSTPPQPGSPSSVNLSVVEAVPPTASTPALEPAKSSVGGASVEDPPEVPPPGSEAGELAAAEEPAAEPVVEAQP